MDVGYVISVLVERLILSMQAYNELVLHQSPQSPSSLKCRGAIEELSKTLESLGHPPTVGTGSFKAYVGSKRVYGYGYVTFPKSRKEFNEWGVYRICGFEREIYWLINGDGSLTSYSRKGYV